MPESIAKNGLSRNVIESGKVILDPIPESDQCQNLIIYNESPDGPRLPSLIGIHHRVRGRHPARLTPHAMHTSSIAAWVNDHGTRTIIEVAAIAP